MIDEIPIEKSASSSTLTKTQTSDSGSNLSSTSLQSDKKEGTTINNASNQAYGEKVPSGSSASPAFDLESFVRDFRHFECQTWHLEPTVRLLSWAGKSIEPYGIDYILNKLGFSHARTTIPKWLQRGFMDPLDKIQALMMLQLLLMVKENKVDSPSKSKSP